MQGLRPLYRYFEFSGRSGRAEFWQFAGLWIAAIFLGLIVDLIIGQTTTPIITIVVIAAGFIPFWAVTFRRLHDRDYSGRWAVAHFALSIFNQLVHRAAYTNAYTTTGDILQTLYWIGITVAVILNVFLLILYVLPSLPDTNRFGPPPSDTEPAPTFGDVAQKVKARAQTVMQPSGTVAPPRPAFPAATTAPRPISDTDPLAQIERLAKLREAGMLTDDEFQAQKAALLARL